MDDDDDGNCRELPDVNYIQAKSSAFTPPFADTYQTDRPADRVNTRPINSIRNVRAFPIPIYVYVCVCVCILPSRVVKVVTHLATTATPSVVRFVSFPLSIFYFPPPSAYFFLPPFQLSTLFFSYSFFFFLFISTSERQRRLVINERTINHPRTGVAPEYSNREGDWF